LIASATQAAVTSTFGPADALRLMAGSAVLGLPGWLAYSGRWRRWTTGAYGSAFRNFPFGLAWMGAGGILLSLAGLIAGLGRTPGDVAYVVLGVPAIVIFCCGVVFALRTPRRFLPAWYHQRPQKELS
jgi:hypothetical protein